MNNDSGMSKRQMRRAKMRRDQMRGRLIGLSVIVGVALCAAAVLIYPNFKPVGTIATAEEFARPRAQANAAGDPDAPIKIEEFSDFQCPYCGNFYRDTERQLVDTYVATGKVYLVYRSFGAFIGGESGRAAEAAYCAGDQNKFWEMHDIIFANQTGENVGDYTDKRLDAFAQAIGLDMAGFDACFGSGKYADQVDQDLVDGRAAGVTATPSFVLTYTVGGTPKSSVIAGAYPFSEFQTQIDAALAEMGLQ